MKITGDKKLRAQLSKLPVKSQHRIAQAVRRSTEEGARVARALAPVREGYTKGDIFTIYDPDGMRGSVEAAGPTKDEQIRAGAIEFGRKKGERGTTAPQPYIRPAQEFVGRKFGRSIKRAVNRALKDATSG